MRGDRRIDYIELPASDLAALGLDDVSWNTIREELDEVVDAAVGSLQGCT